MEEDNSCKFPMKIAYVSYRTDITKLYEIKSEPNSETEHMSKKCCELPVEIWKQIFGYLPAQDQYEIRLVSRNFKHIIDDKYIHKFTLNITENNVKAIREAIEQEKIGKFFFKRLQLMNLESTGDIQFILKTIGYNVEKLSLDNTAIFEGLKDHVQNLKSFELHCKDRFSENLSHLNLSELLPLEHIVLSFPYQDPEIIKILLCQLEQEPEKMLKLKHLKLDCYVSIQKNVINVLKVSTALVHLELGFLNIVQNIDNLWEEILPHFMQLKTLRLNVACCENWLNMLFTSLPKEAPLEHLEVEGRMFKINDTLLTLVANKWKNSLSAIKLANCSFLTDVGVIVLKNLPNLRSLELSPLFAVSSEGFLQAFATKPNTKMEELNLSNFMDLDEWSLSIMPFRMPNLRILKLKLITQAITDNVLAQIFRFQTELRILDLDLCTKITDEGLIGFGNTPFAITRLKYLNALVLRNCHKLTDLTLTAALHLPSLRILKLKSCHNITIKGIKNLVVNCPRLQTLGITARVITDDNVIPIIGHGLKRLSLLYVYSCAATDEEEARIEKNLSILREGYSLQIMQQ